MRPRTGSLVAGLLMTILLATAPCRPVGAGPSRVAAAREPLKELRPQGRPSEQALAPQSVLRMPAALPARPQLVLTMQGIGPSGPTTEADPEPFASRRGAPGEILTRLLSAESTPDSGTQPPGRAVTATRRAHALSRLLYVPSHELCRLTGADRAQLDLTRRRVTFTWFVKLP